LKYLLINLDTKRNIERFETRVSIKEHLIFLTAFFGLSLKINENKRKIEKTETKKMII